MVSILPAERTPWEVISKQIGEGLQQTLPGAVERGYNRGQLQQSLGSIAKLANDPTSSNLDVILGVLQAGAGIPGSERYLSALTPEVLKAVEAKRSQNQPLPGEISQQQRNREPVEQPQPRQPLPNYLNQPSAQTGQFFPNNLGPQGGPGQVPQAATAGVKAPLLTRDEQIGAARRLSDQLTKSGKPTSVPEALELIRKDEEDKKLYNAEVDEELAKRVEGQKTYGQRAVEYLRGIFKKDDPLLTPEMEAIFQKKGEEASKRGESEADINRYLANEAKLFKNAVVNVRNDLSAPRLQNMPERMARGTYKNFKQSAEDVRGHIQPLLDLGLFDTARDLLNNKGYGIEESEMILHPLSPQSSSIINQAPEIKSGFLPSQKFKTTPIDIDDIKNSLKQIKQIDPDFSPVLARKAFENRGYDWRSFKDAWNELVKEGFELSSDQRNQSGHLNTPPLTVLDRLLEGFKIIGR